MKNLNKGTDQAVKMTGLITGSRKANNTHRQSPEVHAMSKPGSGVRTNAKIPNITVLCSLELTLTSITYVFEVVKNIMNCEKNDEL